MRYIPNMIEDLLINSECLHAHVKFKYYIGTLVSTLQNPLVKLAVRKSICLPECLQPSLISSC